MRSAIIALFKLNGTIILVFLALMLYAWAAEIRGPSIKIQGLLILLLAAWIIGNIKIIIEKRREIISSVKKGTIEAAAAAIEFKETANLRAQERIKEKKPEFRKSQNHQPDLTTTPDQSKKEHMVRYNGVLVRVSDTPKESGEALRIASAISNLLKVQISMCRSSKKITSDWAIGYIGGFTDGTLHYKRIGTNETGTTIALLVFNSVFGDDKGIYYFKEYAHLKSSENIATAQGENIGSHEAVSLLNGSTERALGLISYCLEQEQPQTLLDQIEDIGEKIIIDGYRRLAIQNDCAPTEKTSDCQIIEIYKKVGTAFREASEQRGELLPAGTLNNIVLKFINVKEMLGDEMFDQHLNYEVQKYFQEGLRPDYQYDLKLF